jgi:hypothetical protein
VSHPGSPSVPQNTHKWPQHQKHEKGTKKLLNGCTHQLSGGFHCLAAHPVRVPVEVLLDLVLLLGWGKSTTGVLKQNWALDHVLFKEYVARVSGNLGLTKR